MGGCFNVCELCGRELIEGSAAIIKSLEWSTSVLSSVDNLEVWCAVCQKTMRLITGPNYVKGWYACEPQDSPCASHAVVISISETKAMQAAEGGAKS